MSERHQVTDRMPRSETDEDHEAFAIACLRRMIERSEAWKKRRDYADAIRRLETGAACATLQDAAWGLANV